jgi:hypothetical protein
MRNADDLIRRSRAAREQSALIIAQSDEILATAYALRARVLHLCVEPFGPHPDRPRSLRHVVG